MQCSFCKGRLAPSRTTYAATRRGYDLLIHDVPALVCNQCGEAHFEERSVQAIQELLVQIDARSAQIHAAAP